MLKGQDTFGIASAAAHPHFFAVVRDGPLASLLTESVWEAVAGKHLTSWRERLLKAENELGGWLPTRTCASLCQKEAWMLQSPLPTTTRCPDGQEADTEDGSVRRRRERLRRERLRRERRRRVRLLRRRRRRRRQPWDPEALDSPRRIA